MAKLIVFGSSGEKKEHALTDNTSIGRTPDNTIALVEGGLSKKHALIVKSNDDYVLTDLGSTNGTMINGKKILGKTNLKHGDEVSFGGIKAQFMADLPITEVKMTSAPTLAMPTKQKSKSNTPVLNLKLTISGTGLNSKIQERLVMASKQFLPEKDLPETGILRRDYEKLRIAHDLMLAAGKEIELDRLFEKIIDSSFAFLPADRGAALLYDDNNVLQPRVIRYRDKNVEQEMVISSSMVKLVEAEKIGILSYDALEDPRFSNAQSVINQGIRSSIAVPLLDENNLLGILFFDSLVTTHAFSEKDLQVLSTIAGQAALMVANAKLAEKHAESAIARSRLEQMFSPAIADLISMGKKAIAPGGEPKRVTVVFADIRGFTNLSEKSDATAVVELLNGYFERMVDAIFKFDGTLDKFVGDEIMALFGAPIDRPDDAKRAVMTALAMLAELQHFNDERGKRGQSSIRIGIGINTGEVIAGYIGSPKAMQYTVVGSPVNLASRLCSAAGHGSDILVSESTWLEIRDAFETVEQEPVSLKGFSQPVRTFRVVGETTSKSQSTTK